MQNYIDRLYAVLVETCEGGLEAYLILIIPNYYERKASFKFIVGMPVIG
jgi:hypothetical protein